MELSVSILNSKDRKNMIKILNDTNISYIHIDTMDGKFVKETNFNTKEIKELSQVTNKKLDIHLMVLDPIEYIEKLKELNNIEYITVHLEIDKDIKSILKQIRSYGIKSGISIKPNTDIKDLLPYLEYIDLILVMTVEPGYGGQPFISTSPNRINKIKELIKDYNIKIEVDGGINDNTISKVKEADLVVVGSYITKSDDPVSKINNLIV